MKSLRYRFQGLVNVHMKYQNKKKNMISVTLSSEYVWEKKHHEVRLIRTGRKATLFFFFFTSRKREIIQNISFFPLNFMFNANIN